MAVEGEWTASTVINGGNSAAMIQKHPLSGFNVEIPKTGSVETSWKPARATSKPG